MARRFCANARIRKRLRRPSATSRTPRRSRTSWASSEPSSHTLRERLATLRCVASAQKARPKACPSFWRCWSSVVEGASLRTCAPRRSQRCSVASASRTVPWCQALLQLVGSSCCWVCFRRLPGWMPITQSWRQRRVCLSNSARTMGRRWRLCSKIAPRRHCCKSWPLTHDATPPSEKTSGSRTSFWSPVALPAVTAEVGDPTAWTEANGSGVPAPPSPVALVVAASRPKNVACRCRRAQASRCTCDRSWSRLAIPSRRRGRSRRSRHRLRRSPAPQMSACPSPTPCSLLCAKPPQLKGAW
mmetsp:Transcript_83004/g.231663  ORF Transcript_83004/g.231663 Transcript_83004/m.231663 type:complete len:301 (+) Transcript_83004:305-1207(+)